MPAQISRASTPEPDIDQSYSPDESMPTSCWQNFKSKITAFGKKIEDWTYRKLPPTAAKCVLFIAKYLPIAIAMLLLPTSIVLSLFAICTVVRIICPEVFTSHDTVRGVASAAARTMGIYSSIMGIYNALAFSFSSTPYYCLVSMGVHLAIAGASFYTGNQWADTAKPATPPATPAAAPPPAVNNIQVNTDGPVPASPPSSPAPTPRIAAIIQDTPPSPSSPLEKPTNPRGNGVALVPIVAATQSSVPHPTKPPSPKAKPASPKPLVSAPQEPASPPESGFVVVDMPKPQRPQTPRKRSVTPTLGKPLAPPITDQLNRGGIVAMPRRKPPVMMSTTPLATATASAHHRRQASKPLTIQTDAAATAGHPPSPKQHKGTPVAAVVSASAKPAASREPNSGNELTTPDS